MDRAGPVAGIERGQIQAGLCQGMTQAAIAVIIGRNPGTISWEIRRNSSADGIYYAAVDHA